MTGFSGCFRWDNGICRSIFMNILRLPGYHLVHPFKKCKPVVLPVIKARHQQGFFTPAYPVSPDHEPLNRPYLPPLASLSSTKFSMKAFKAIFQDCPGKDRRISRRRVPGGNSPFVMYPHDRPPKHPHCSLSVPCYLGPPSVPFLVTYRSVMSWIIGTGTSFPPRATGEVWTSRGPDLSA